MGANPVSGEQAMATVAGLPLPGLEGCTPLSALVILRGLDEDGAVAYYARATDGLTSVEALGMAVAAVEKLKAAAAEDVA